MKNISGIFNTWFSIDENRHYIGSSCLNELNILSWYVRWILGTKMESKSSTGIVAKLLGFENRVIICQAQCFNILQPTVILTWDRIPIMGRLLLIKEVEQVLNKVCSLADCHLLRSTSAAKCKEHQNTIRFIPPRLPLTQHVIWGLHICCALLYRWYGDYGNNNLSKKIAAWMNYHLFLLLVTNVFSDVTRREASIAIPIFVQWRDFHTLWRTHWHTWMKDGHLKF